MDETTTKISTGIPMSAIMVKNGIEVMDEYHEFLMPNERLKCSPS
jgi:hypothetical protein